MKRYRVGFQVHLTNPQVQLHSKQTKGSVVIAMSGAYVEGREFLKLVRDNSHYFKERGGAIDDVNAGILKKNEIRYMLDRVEAYAMPTDIDVSAGLQWLEVISMEEKERREREKTKKDQEREKREELAMEIERNIQMGGSQSESGGEGGSDMSSLGSSSGRGEEMEGGESSDDDASIVPVKSDIETMLLGGKESEMETNSEMENNSEEGRGGGGGGGGGERRKRRREMFWKTCPGREEGGEEGLRRALPTSTRRWYLLHLIS